MLKSDLIAIYIYIPNPCLQVSSLLHLSLTCALLYMLVFSLCPLHLPCCLCYLLISLSCALLSVRYSSSFSLHRTSSMSLSEDGAWCGY